VLLARPIHPANRPVTHHPHHPFRIAGNGFKSLAEGAKVSYDAEQGPQGPTRSTPGTAAATRARPWSSTRKSRRTRSSTSVAGSR
jgi:hypothetical protein